MHLQELRYTKIPQKEKGIRHETWCRFITVKKEGNQEMFLLDRPYQLLLLNFFSCITILKLYNNAAARLKLKWLQSSRTMEFELSLTIHFFYKVFELKSCCLQTSYFPQDHTGDNIEFGLKEALAEWGLCEECLVTITTDSASNIIKAVELND